jgi:UDP-2,3-diacylglucosamine pyrophosphatase LpxH
LVLLEIVVDLEGKIMLPVSTEYLEELVILHGDKLIQCDVSHHLLSHVIDNPQQFGVFVNDPIWQGIGRQESFSIGCR